MIVAADRGKDFARAQSGLLAVRAQSKTTAAIRHRRLLTQVAGVDVRPWSWLCENSSARRARENNKVPARNAPNSDQEPQRSRGPDDRPAPPHRDEMNREKLRLLVTQPPHHRPLPSRIASQRRNHRPKKLATDFCNKICTNATSEDIFSPAA